MGPALPLDDAGPYVAAAYLVFLALVLIYVVIMASRLARHQRDIVELDEERKAAMVSNLMVVLVSDRGAQPVVNSGSLYT